MAKFTKTLIAAGLLAAAATPAFAADYSGDIHKNDYKWMQFNVMHTIDQRPIFTADGNYNDTYLEMEFGGRSGLFDLYGYVDVFDIFDSRHSDKHDKQNIFMKFAPRLSLDALTGKDLSIGPVQEWYIASLNNVADGQMENLIGIGSDVQVPWFGKVGMNLYARHSTENANFEAEEGKWNGYQFSMNWFKPFYHFSDTSFVSFQGYLDYTWDMDTYGVAGRHSDGLGTLGGIYYHTDRYVVGYAIKYFNEIYGIDNNADSKSTGFGHYFNVSYKF
ncbi:outer membrane protein OmpK [Aeromonas enteropelogenes]|uniref:nucleoside-specific channel-forming Tsx family protein n=1 Tax=Aeromonas enteropelogenes TaxID=29489 RepID=UPI001CCD2A93|nr:outer membrane protein OmpK [Aeromonas enteropelogenes]UBH27280.1 outer membrane protein OmpK [Aeromonas enteropelogenes]